MLARKLNLTPLGYKNLKIAVIACTIANLASFLPFIILMQIIVTIVQPLTSEQPLQTSKLWLLFIAGLVAAALFFIAYLWEYRKTYTSAYRESMNMRIQVAEHMRKLPMSFFNRHNLADLTTNLMADCSTVEQVMSHVIPQMLGYTLSCAIACFMIAIYNWKMALTIFCVLPFSVIIIFIGKKMEERLSRKHVQAKLNVSDQVQEYLEGIKVIKAFGLAGDKYKTLQSALKQMMNASIRFELLAGIFVSGATVLLQTGIGLVVLVGVTLLAQGSLDIFSFLGFVLVSVRIYNPIIAIMTLLPAFFYLLISLEKMQQLRQTPTMEGQVNVLLEKFDIAINGISFAYDKKNVIDKLNLYIPPNKVTAIVGASGSGKTTISRLIARFWDVNEGNITVGGHDIKKIHPETLMRSMSFVFQDVTLFNDTVFNNIQLGRQDATDQEVYEAAQKAQCEQFIQKLPQGYQTLLSENGNILSGGERQRLSIARALLKNAPIILLDEATASLDPENETLIQKALSQLLSQRTVIVIAHRLKTIINADQIAVLQQGKLVEVGNFKELMQNKSAFYHLYTLQQQSMGWHV